jgi:hypothetical protein
MMGGGPERITMGAGGGGGGQMVVTSMAVGGAAGMAGAERMISSGGAGGPNMPAPEYVLPSELPDYAPPFASGAVRADEDGNLWILSRPAKVVDGGPIYDVVNKSGLVDRVQIPKGMTLAGFGKGGIVYLITRESGQAYLAKARFK